MKTNPMHEGAIMIHGTGVGTITSGMILDRASELALIDGRAAADASRSDREEAERNLQEGTGMTCEQALLESLPESDRWNPVPGTAGREAAVEFDDDEDEDGRSVEERLVQSGVAEADHDQKLAAARSAFLSGA